ncbi:MAG: T9SS type A sorting domain-containing protein [Prevotella sp.]|nr:T9SS type A sorting domain-containing protein [Prevotella sp.]
MRGYAEETAGPATEQIDDRAVNVIVSGSILSVTGAAGETLEVVSLTGKHVMTVKIESPAQRIELNVPKGCYILKIGKVVRKVAIR